jgi:hypothetical protein
MNCSRELLEAILDAAEPADLVDNTTLSTYVYDTMCSLNTTLNRVATLKAAKQTLINDRAELDARIANVKATCPHTLTHTVNSVVTCSVCGATP